MIACLAYWWRFLQLSCMQYDVACNHITPVVCQFPSTVPLQSVWNQLMIRLHASHAHSQPGFCLLSCSLFDMTTHECTSVRRVSWSEFEHWLWPAFSPRWASWRQRRLGLPPALFTGDDAAPPLDGPMHPTSDPAMRTVTSSATPSCNKASEAHGVSQGRTESTSTDAHQGVGRGNSCNLLASIPLLYGLSKQIIPQPGYWPSSVHCCGFWQQKHTGTVSSLHSCCPNDAGTPLSSWS